MAKPADVDRVLLGLRLGWAMAEVRGRLRNGDPGPDKPERPDRALPLSDERGWSEQTIETEEVLRQVAKKLELDFGMGEKGDGERAAERLERFSKKLGTLRKASPRDAEAIRVTWDDTSEFFFEWDAKIQDALAADSFTVASAYQLGRGLAETFWMLDPTATGEDPRSSIKLFGEERQQIFARLLPRLSAYFPDAASSAVAASVLAWAEAADDGLLREKPEAVEALHEQLRVWHDLLLVGQPPETRIAANALLSRARRIGPVLRAFVPEIALGLLSLAAAAAAAALFALGTGSAAIAPVLSVLSFFGVTSAGALAKAKGEAHTLFDQLGKAMDADLIKQAVTVLPARAYLDRPRRPLTAAPKERGMVELEASLSKSPLAPA